MLIIPAIDLQDGAVVRLYQGRYEDKKIYSQDPLTVAKQWESQGAELIHIVDLDGALRGVPKNIALLKRILQAVRVPIEFGGGLRDIEMIRSLLAEGIQRVVLGTKAAQDQEFLSKIFKEFKDRVIVSIDVKEEKVAVKGWKEDCRDTNLIEFAQALKITGFSRLIYTDILRDGTLSGPNIKGIEGLLSKTGLKIIASGGISSLADIAGLKELEKQGLEAVIIGRALYEGRFSLPQALKLK